MICLRAERRLYGVMLVKIEVNAHPERIFALHPLVQALGVDFAFARSRQDAAQVVPHEFLDVAEFDVEAGVRCRAFVFGRDGDARLSAEHQGKAAFVFDAQLDFEQGFAAARGLELEGGLSSRTKEVMFFSAADFLADFSQGQSTIRSRFLMMRGPSFRMRNSITPISSALYRWLTLISRLTGGLASKPCCCSSIVQSLHPQSQYTPAAGAGGAWKSCYIMSAVWQPAPTGQPAPGGHFICSANSLTKMPPTTERA